MTVGRSTTPALPRRAFRHLAGAGRTGALRVDGEPGGTLYLLDGRVSFAESSSAPGVGELLTTSGRLDACTWAAAVAQGRAAHRVGARLLEQGHLTRGELELCVLGVIYDAAYFVLLTHPARVRFVPGKRHWLGAISEVEAPVLDREVTRRRRLLNQIHPSSIMDTAPVQPVRRPPVERVVLTAPQWELLMQADGRRTAPELSRRLGRAGYVTVQQLRQLAAAGLITVGSGAGEAQHHPASRSDVSQEAVEKGPGTRRATARKVAARRPSGNRRAATSATAVRPALPQREPGACLPTAAGVRQTYPDGGPFPGARPDDRVLRRIHTALRALS